MKPSSGLLRALAIVPVVLALALALAPGAAVAAEPTSGYNSEPQKPSTTTPTTPKTGTLPSKEAEEPASTTPAKETEPAKASTSPASEEASTLPFTGFDLRWDIGLGLILLGAGVSIVLLQRRQRRHGGG